MNFAFELMQDAGLAKPKARPEGNDPPHSVCKMSEVRGEGVLRPWINFLIKILLIIKDFLECFKLI